MKRHTAGSFCLSRREGGPNPPGIPDADSPIAPAAVGLFSLTGFQTLFPFPRTEFNCHEMPL